MVDLKFILKMKNEELISLRHLAPSRLCGERKKAIGFYGGCFGTSCLAMTMATVVIRGLLRHCVPRNDNSQPNPHCVRDLSGKPGARNERGLGTESPTRRGTPKKMKN